MQGTRKPPASEVVEAAKGDGRHDRTPYPPVTRESVVPRRDGRAEPDDDPGSSISRVDVVNVEGGGGSGGGGRDLAASGIIALRRELAKLNQQAAAVEKSLEEQRRDRSDAVERLERMAERVAQLESQLAGADEEARSLRRLHEAAMQEVQNARAERDDLSRAVEAAKAATSELSKLREEAERHKSAAEEKDGELISSRAKLERATADADRWRSLAAKATEEGAKATERADKATNEAAKAREDAAKAREETARAKADNTRDRETARDKIDLLERALDDARAAASRTEQQLEASRNDCDQLTGRLELAETKLAAAAAAHAALEQSVRAVRDDVAAAFSRLGSPVASPTLTSPQPGIVSIPPEAIKSVPPSVPPPLPHAPRTAGSIDSGWPAPTDPGPEPSPASKSVPPPASASATPPALPNSIPPPTYASVPPQVHASGAIEHSSLPPALSVETPAVHEGFAPPGALRRSTPPDPSPAEDVEYAGPGREELFARLEDPTTAAEAAAALRERPRWLVSAPPPSLMSALASVDYDAEGPVFDLARAWEREPLCQALITSLRSDESTRLREHSAWVLKHLAAPSAWKEIADLARNDAEPIQLRRWLLEALDRLAAGRGIGWDELGDLVTTIAKHPDATLRDGVVGILVSLDRSDDKRRLLLDILRDDDDEGVIASAVNALASVLPIELDPLVVERLLGHPSPRVQRSLRDLIERARREAKT